MAKIVRHQSRISYEFKTLEILHDAGADVPKPYAMEKNAILMGFVGDLSNFAPALSSMSLELDKAQPLFERVIHNIDLMLTHGRIYGDLFAYNILYWDGDITLIDFPQVVLPEANPASWNIFLRDVTRIRQYFSVQGARCNVSKLASDLWASHGYKIIKNIASPFRLAMTSFALYCKIVFRRFNLMNNVRPHLTLMTEEQIQEAHQNTLRVLSETGVRVDSPTILKMLEQKLGLKSQDRIIKFPPEVVEQAIRSAPKTIDIYDRRGKFKLKLGEDHLRFGVGVTALFYQEPVNDKLELFTRKNFQDLVRLGSALPLYDVISTVGILRDVKEEFTDLYGSLEHISNTTKPIVLLVSDEDKFPAVLEMFEKLHGDLGVRPFVIPYFNPVSPLGMNAGTVDKMKVAIERGLPIIFSNYSMAGASTPLTPAGTLTLLMAELLAGLVISQTVKKGAPILLGMLPVYFDMRTMLNFYDPQSILISVACSEMMNYYGIPHCATSGSGTGWGMDLIAADTYWMNTLALLLSGGHLAPFIGDSLGSKSISPTTIVHVHEIIDQAMRFANGFQLDDVNSAVDEINKVGPGRSFLNQPSTLKNYKTGYYVSRVYPRYSMEKWQEAGAPPAHQVLREKTQDLLANLPVPDDHDELMGRGEEFIKKL